jgi:hypothetical protein
MAEEGADIHRVIGSLKGRPLQEQLAGMLKARQRLLTAVPEAAERARKTVAQRGARGGHSARRSPAPPKAEAAQDGRPNTQRPPHHDER